MTNGACTAKVNWPTFSLHLNSIGASKQQVHTSNHLAATLVIQTQTFRGIPLHGAA